VTLYELLEKIYKYLNGIKKPFDQRDRIEYIRLVVNMIEDGLTWTQIKKEITTWRELP
jgi:hypothetical protein